VRIGGRGRGASKANMQNPHIPAPKEQVIPTAENFSKAALLIALLFVSFALTQRGMRALAASGFPGWLAVVLTWVLILGMAIWHGVLILGMGVLAHDAVHKVLFRSRYWNELWGGLLSAFTLIPFYANRQFHLAHHGYAHQPGLDPENEMHDRPFLCAVTAGSLLGLYVHYRILLINALRLQHRRYSGRVIKDALFLAIVGLVYFGLVPAFGISVWVTVVPMILAFPLVFAWRALSDHYAIPAIERAARRKEEILDADEDAWHRDREKRNREVTGWVVLTHPWLEWLWSHVNYHEVHHKYPWLSHRYLKGAFAATREHQPYLVIQGYWRSLFNLRRRQYYATRAEMRPFLTTPDW
jgi:fatty acid desaturase